MVQTPGGSSLAGVAFPFVEPKLQAGSDGKGGPSVAVRTMFRFRPVRVILCWEAGVDRRVHGLFPLLLRSFRSLPILRLAAGVDRRVHGLRHYLRLILSDVETVVPVAADERAGTTLALDVLQELNLWFVLSEADGSGRALVLVDHRAKQEIY